MCNYITRDAFHYFVYKFHIEILLHYKITELVKYLKYYNKIILVIILLIK